MSIDTSKFFLTRSPRPMLARDADSVYWMSRYVERAEHIARILLVNSNLLIDIGDLAPELQQRQWQAVIDIMRSTPLPAVPESPANPLAAEVPLAQRVAQHMTFNTDNPNSLFNCIARARENARGVRETISAEMWENLNTLYWTLRDAPARFEESPEDVYRQVMIGSMLFQGLTDQTLPHGQRWYFAQLAKYLERIDVTCRVIESTDCHWRSCISGASSPMSISRLELTSRMRAMCSARST